MKVLLIEDDENIADFLSVHLPAHSFVVDVAQNGASSLRLMRTNEYDIVVLDYHLPDMNGEEVIGRLRAQGIPTPVLLLTVVTDAWSKARLLDAGADDYLEKPFLLEELVARMRALLRRAPHAPKDILKSGNLTLDTETQLVQRAGKIIPLTRKEFVLLEYLLHHKGKLVPKTTLIEHAWDSSGNPFSATLDTHMTNLRRKLGSPELIETVHGRGFLVA